MNYKKTLSIIGSIIAVGAMLFTGCHDKTGDKDKYLTYCEYAGTAVGYIVNASGMFVGPEVKTAITNVLEEIEANLPKEVTVDTIATDMKTLATNAIAKIHVSEKYEVLVNKSVDTFLTLLQVGLQNIKEKYPVEVENAEMFYTIAYKFLDSVKVVLDPVSSRNSGDEIEFTIAQVTYGEIENMAKADGKKIIEKRDFDSIVEKLNASTK